MISRSNSSGITNPMFGQMQMNSAMPSMGLSPMFGQMQMNSAMSSMGMNPMFGQMQMNSAMPSMPMNPMFGQTQITNPMMPMNNYMHNMMRNNNIYAALNEINKYIGYIQGCLLNSFKGNNDNININEIINAIITHILNYYDYLKSIELNSSTQENNTIINNFSINYSDNVYEKLDNINLSIYKFLNELNVRLLSNRKDYQYILNNLINIDKNKNKNDILLYLKKLNEYIIVLQDSLLKYLKAQKNIANLSDLINNINNFNETIKLIHIIPNNNMNPNYDTMNNFMGMNMMNNNMMPMAMPQNPMFGPGFMNMNMSYPFNNFNNNNFIDSDEANRIFNITKYLVDKFLNDLKSLTTLNKKEYIEGGKYFEPIEVKNENDKIIDKINSKVCKYIEIGEKQNNSTLETEGKLLYLIGGIARKSLEITNRLYSELFEEYKKDLHDPNKFNHSILDKKNFSSWAKNKYDIKEFIKVSAGKNEYQINKYITKSKDEYFLKELYNDFLSLFLKCSLSIPLVEIEFLNDKNMIDKQIDTNDMIDLIIKNKRYKVNFCFLPKLSSNGGLIQGAKFHVFTYNEHKTYKHENIDYEEVKQNAQLNY